MPEDAPDKWAEFIEYNRQDVVVEKATGSSARLTGLDNPNSTLQLKDWLSNHLGYEVETMRKEDLSNLLSQDIPSDVHTVLNNLS